MTNRVGSLQAVRGAAAALVTLFHLQDVAVRDSGIMPWWGLFGAGDRGVDLFFVLSGFIILWSHEKDIGTTGAAARSVAARYAVKRAARITPSVWILSAAAGAVYLLGFGGYDKAAKLDLWHVVASVMLLPQPSAPLVNVTWTLTYEVFFYALFGLLILDRRAGLAALAAWQGLVGLTIAGAMTPSGWLQAYYLRPICLEFGIGMGCAYLVRHQLGVVGRRWAGPCLLAVGCCVVAGSMAAEGLMQRHVLEPVRLLCYGAGSGALIAGAVLTEMRRPLAIPAALQWLGAVSYPLYLLNFSVITLAWALMIRIGPGVAALVGPVLCPLLALGAAGAFERWVDGPVQQALRRWTQTWFVATHRLPALEGAIVAGVAATAPAGAPPARN